MSQSTHPTPTQYGRIHPPDEAWLARAPREPILEPDLPIIDTHHHLWVRPNHRYLLDELLADLRTGHNVVATVFLECHSMYRADGPVEMRPVGETEFVAGIAAMSDSGQYGPTRVAAGIVGFADLTLGRPGRARAAGAHPRRRRTLPRRAALGGVGRQPDHRQLRRRDRPARDAAARSSAPGWRGSPRSACRSTRGSFIRSWPTRSIWRAASPTPTSSWATSAGRSATGRTRASATRSSPPGRPAILELATCPNVTMKLGGMMMRLAAFDYGAAAAPISSEALAALWRPYIEPCIERFGANRCMFESNFPVDKMGIGYGPLWNALKRIAAGASADEKLALFSGTARRVYRL